MFKIVTKRALNPNTKLFEIYAPRVAAKAQPGQFVIFRVDDVDKRVPLTIADFDRERGTITMVALELGVSTKRLGKMEVGDSLADFVGPLGHPTHLEKFGNVVCVGGGTGIAAVYPIARGMKQTGNHVISIIGARTKDLLFYDEELRAVSDEYFVASNDGSVGQQGLVTNVLQEIIDSGMKIDLVIAVGPVIMMKAIAELTRGYGIKTVSSLNPIMVDGTGMCGCCRVIVNNETKFACVDGPEFDAHLVDFDNLMARLKMFNAQEAEMNEHECRIGLDK
ncbi:MAG: sulfide/dihydroorotate dehydrogenase-like FAD/NAD-binding protein [Negativicutes bacterium]